MKLVEAGSNQWHNFNATSLNDIHKAEYRLNQQSTLENASLASETSMQAYWQCAVMLPLPYT